MKRAFSLSGVAALFGALSLPVAAHASPRDCAPGSESYACVVETADGEGATLGVEERANESDLKRDVGVGTAGASCRYVARGVGRHPLTGEPVAEHDAPVDAGGRWFEVDCGEGASTYRWYVPGDEEEGASPEALLREVVQSALGQVDAGVGRLRLAPVDPAPHITGLPSWLAIEPEDWATRTATVTAGTISVTAMLEPQRVEWSLGDGGQTACEGPGTIYDTDRSYESQSTDCTYTYAVASTLDDPDGTYPVSAHIVYAASFTVDSPIAELNGTFDLGELEGPPTTEDIVVRQIQAVRTSG